MVKRMPLASGRLNLLTRPARAAEDAFWIYGYTTREASAVLAAIAKCGMPEGAFALIKGGKRDVGQSVVQHPAIKAVGFTGLRGGGRAHGK